MKRLRTFLILFVTFSAIISAFGLRIYAQNNVVSPLINQVWKTGDKVGAQWSKDEKYYGANIVETKDGRYKVHYMGEKNDSGDEWREPSQLRPFKEWTWTNAANETKTEQDLRDIIAQHKIWLDSDGQQGLQANLSGAAMSGANLSSTILKRANLEKIHLMNTNLKGADLTESNLKGAILISVDLSAAFLDSADFTNAIFSGVTDISNSLMEKANLSGASLISTKMNDTFLVDANLTDATLLDTDLSGAAFDGADLKNVTFDPKKNPEIRYLASALNLETLKYQKLSGSLISIEQEFKKSGFSQQENKIIYALKRMENRFLWEDAFTIDCNANEKNNTECENAMHRGRECADGICPGEPQNVVYYYLNLIFFDWTVRYGMRPQRALRLLVVLWLICALIYDFFVHHPGRNGLYLVKTWTHRDPSRKRAMRILLYHRHAGKGRTHWWRWLKSEWRILRICLYYSLMTAFNIGFKEFDVGRWLGMLKKREYEITPRHWTRTITGFQSLISLYLIAMWILSHFGKPFE